MTYGSVSQIQMEIFKVPPTMSVTYCPVVNGAYVGSCVPF